MQTDNQRELLPCPFCGKACQSFQTDSSGKWGRIEPSCLEVRTGYNIFEDAPWKKEAAAAWNTRSAPAMEAPRDAVERVTFENIRFIEYALNVLVNTPVDGWESKVNLLPVFSEMLDKTRLVKAALVSRAMPTQSAAQCISLAGLAAADFLDRLSEILSPVKELKDLRDLASDHSKNLRGLQITEEEDNVSAT